MTEVLQKYRFILVALGLVLIAMLIWLLLTRQSTDKVPSRGVFVLKTGISYHDSNVRAIGGWYA